MPGEQAVSIEPVKLLGHAVEAFAAIDQDRLRSLEALAGRQLPAEVLRMDANHRPQMVVPVPIHPDAVVPAVDQLEGPDLAAVLRGLRRAEGGKGRILRPAGPASAADGKLSFSLRIKYAGVVNREGALERPQESSLTAYCKTAEIQRISAVLPLFPPFRLWQALRGIAGNQPPRPVNRFFQ